LKRDETAEIKRVRIGGKVEILSLGEAKKYRKQINQQYRRMSISGNSF
jgi:hypothetical protein